MGILSDYFTADSDTDALRALGDGPEGLFDTVDLGGIEPVVQLGTLESLLTTKHYDEVVADPRAGQNLLPGDDAEAWVITVTDHLRDALAAASADRLAEVAHAWSATEEITATPAELTPVLIDLADLARRATAAEQHLYCWLSL